MVDSPEARNQDAREAAKHSHVGRILVGLILLLILYVLSEPWITIIIRKSSPDPPPVWIEVPLSAYSFPVEFFEENSTTFDNFYSRYFVFVFETVY